MTRTHFFARLFGKACLAFCLFAIFTTSVSAELKCLFVCRDRNTHWTGVAYDRIEALGFTMTEVHDNGAFNGFPSFTSGNFGNGQWTAAMLEEYDLIFFDYDSSSGNADHAALANCTKPVVIQKFLGLDSVHDITDADASVHDSTVTSQTQVVIANLVGNPILAEAGVTPGSTVTFATAPGRNIQSINVNSGATGLAPGAVVLATVPGSSATFPGSAVFWTLDTGAARHVGTSPARRAGFGFFGAFPGTPVVSGAHVYSVNDITPTTVKLFDAMIHWLVPASAIEVTVTPPSISINTTASVTTRTLTVVATNVSSSITLQSATLTPAGSPFSIVTPTLPVNILTGTTQTLNVVFTPTTQGTFATTATLNFTNSRGPKTVTVPITATATVNSVKDWMRFE